MQDSSQTNREYKDRLFKFIFGNPEHKEWTLSLYNAVNGSHYDDPSAITLNTIEDAVYMSMKNDVSFLIADTVNLYEQQSTFNPNMPMRFLIYAGMVYSRYVEENSSYHRYSSKQQHAPTPRCVCFYNGTDSKEDRVILRLSDAFRPGSAPDIEVTATMINVNFGRNGALLEACRPLGDYAMFVDSVRSHQKETRTLDKAIDLALEELPDDAVIKQFLLSNRAEVKYMCITEYDEQRTLAEQRKDGFDDGWRDGYEDGVEEGIRAGRQKGLEEGLQQGLEEGKQQGLKEGKQQGLKEGKQQGLKEGKQQGLEEGKQQGLEEGKQQGLEEGKQQGLKEGKQQGLEEGLQQGMQQGMLKGSLQMLVGLAKKGILTWTQAAEEAHMSLPEFEKLAQSN